ncbi:hypothetical protein DFR75_11277 [Nocardia ignorata]|uniref:Uncharacterized protein n=1 Tax=Nocardia ignorata TaxID=145285 RepID=A0A4R6NYP2_NOCIG|nr:hypothetical protein DFR75_11277 [Nocardia ignorata]
MDPEYVETEPLSTDPEFPWLGYEDDDYDYGQDCN